MIYFIQAEESKRIKIGYTSGRPESRLDGMKTGSPEHLRIMAIIEDGTRHQEGALHKMFAEFKTQGEWFVSAEPLLKYIETHAEFWDRPRSLPVSPPHLGHEPSSRFAPPTFRDPSIVDYEWRQCERCTRFFPSESKRRYCRRCGKELIRELQIKGYLTEVDYELR